MRPSLAMRRESWLVAGAIVLAGTAIAIALAVRTPSHGTSGARPRVAGRVAVPHRSYLFAQDAHAGTFLPVPGRSGVWDLTLTHVHPDALYFTDRPFRQVGTASLEKLLRGFFAKKGGGPPNAAINSLIPALGHQELMGVELLSYRYDKAAGTLVYRVRGLHEAADRRQHGLTDVVLPKQLGHTSVFVDDASPRSCTAMLFNGLPAQLSLSAQAKSSGDSWWHSPSEVTPLPAITDGADPPSIFWNSNDQTDSCSNVSVWTIPNLGTLTVSVSDPWEHGNSWSCTFTPAAGVPADEVECPLYAQPQWLSGDDLEVHFLVCSSYYQLVGMASCYTLLQDAGA